ncbi:acyltransferase family protein [Rothia sp. CCM 9418]|uniref:acyltransferase family protein n=1 Tax=Rothia sp. CCM 9418 TaxID=3402661 RepID=UPI003AECD653
MKHKKPPEYLNPQDYKNGRFYALDGLRGLAILGVIIGHFGSPYNEFFPSQPKSPYEFSFGALGVQLFFMISGFVILLTAIRGKTAKNFVISRFSRLYPSYWVALLMSTFLLLAVGAENHAITIKDAVVNITMFQRFLMVPNVDTVYWTLATEMQFYILMLTYLVLNKGKLNKNFIIGFAIFWSILGFILCNIFIKPTGIPKMIIWLFLAEHAPLFSFGMIMFFYSYDRKFKWYMPLLMFIAAYNAYIQHNITYGVSVFIVTVIFFTVVHFQTCPFLDRGPIYFMGKISYSAYLNHNVMGFILIYLLTPYLGAGWINRIVVFAIVVLWASFLYRFVETTISGRVKNYLLEKFGAQRKNA